MAITLCRKFKIGSITTSVSNKTTTESLDSDLHDFFSLAELEQVDDGVFALSSDAGVLVFGVVEQTLYQGLHQANLQRGDLRVLPHPPQYSLRYQSDVAGLVLKTLWEQEIRDTDKAAK